MYKMKEKIVLKEFEVKYYLIGPDKLRRNKQKKKVIAWKPSAELKPLSALGVLGRRFESCRPDQLL